MHTRQRLRSICVEKPTDGRTPSTKIAAPLHGARGLSSSYPIARIMVVAAASTRLMTFRTARGGLSLLTRSMAKSAGRPWSPSGPTRLCPRLWTPSLGSSALRSYSNTQGMLAKESPSEEEGESAMVYESPFGGLVKRLRIVTLFSTFAGTVGLPLVLWIKGTTATGGFLALCLSFCTGTIGSTAAIHWVFSPYIFTIERM